jgi:hypothetical protein
MFPAMNNVTKDQFIFFPSPFDERTTLALDKNAIKIYTVFQYTEIPSFLNLHLPGSPAILFSFEEKGRTFIFTDQPIQISLFQILHLIPELLPLNTIIQLIQDILKILLQRHNHFIHCSNLSTRDIMITNNFFFFTNRL